MAMTKYGVCKNEKTAGMGPKVGYCEKCNEPMIFKNGKYQPSCDCIIIKTVKKR